MKNWRSPGPGGIQVGFDAGVQSCPISPLLWLLQTLHHGPGQEQVLKEVDTSCTTWFDSFAIPAAPQNLPACYGTPALGGPPSKAVVGSKEDGHLC